MKVAALVSGGVDSSVALARLVATGEHEIVAFYLKIWLEDELAFLGECPWEEDLRYARAVCERLGVPLEVVPLQREYHERVVQAAVAELAAGRTPSPDLHCNARVKLGAFVEAVGGGFDAVATGHYARVGREADGAPVLRRAVDAKKDQTYFLARLARDQLARLVCPVGDLPKAAVRATARDLGLATSERPDSQGICFLGKIPYPDFVRAYLGDAPGPIEDVDTGVVLGEHRGLWYHTIGQRKGLGLGGGPWFVVAKDLAARRLLVAHETRVGPHRRATFTVNDVHWLDGRPAVAAIGSAKVRHGPAMAGCVASERGDGGLDVTLDAPDQGLAAGQFAVFYDRERDRCLGSGVIA